MANSEASSGSLRLQKLCPGHHVPRNGRRGSKKEDGGLVPQTLLPEPFAGCLLQGALLLLLLLWTLSGERLVQQWNQCSPEQPAKSGLWPGTWFDFGLGGELIIHYILPRDLSTHQCGPA